MDVLLDLRLDLKGEISPSLYHQFESKPGNALRVIGALKDIRSKLELAKNDIPLLVKQHLHQEEEVHSHSDDVVPQGDSEPSDTAAQKDLDVFLSYCWEDQHVVRKVKKALEDAKLRCWMDESSIGSGGHAYIYQPNPPLITSLQCYILRDRCRHHLSSCYGRLRVQQIWRARELPT